MARTKARTTKMRESFGVHKSPKKPTTAGDSVVVTVTQLRKRYETIKADRRQRLQRLVKALIGSDRRFAGRVVIPPHVVATQSDFRRLKDIREDVRTGKAAVYWVDGAGSCGYLGAGVVWREGRTIQARRHSLGRNTTGCSGDAELFAIAAAIRRAKRSIRKGSDAQLVRIYTDSQEVLRALRSDNHPWIGPLQDGSPVLRKLYDNTDWLVAHNIRVELIWVKGHSASHGNKIADEAASQAVSAQIVAGKSKSSAATAQRDVPEQRRGLEADWSAERLFRMHRPQVASMCNGNIKITSSSLAEVSKLLGLILTPEPTRQPLALRVSGSDASRTRQKKAMHSTRATTRHSRCIKSLQTWGTATALCATRLRKPSNLDNIAR